MLNVNAKDITTLNKAIININNKLYLMYKMEIVYRHTVILHESKDFHCHYAIYLIATHFANEEHGFTA